jgi:hypothetical protein
MDDNRLTWGGIVSVGVLASSIVIGAEMPTATTLLGPELNVDLEYPHEIVLDDYPDYLKRTSSFSFQYDLIKIGVDIDEDDYPEVKVIEIPIVKKMIFQFNKPVKLEFS